MLGAGSDRTRGLPLRARAPLALANRQPVYTALSVIGSSGSLRASSGPPRSERPWSRETSQDGTLGVLEYMGGFDAARGLILRSISVDRAAGHVGGRGWARFSDFDPPGSGACPAVWMHGAGYRYAKHHRCIVAPDHLRAKVE
jgi:hypothetical protein